MAGEDGRGVLVRTVRDPHVVIADRLCDDGRGGSSRF